MTPAGEHFAGVDKSRADILSAPDPGLLQRNGTRGADLIPVADPYEVEGGVVALAHHSEHPKIVPAQDRYLSLWGELLGRRVHLMAQPIVTGMEREQGH